MLRLNRVLGPLQGRGPGTAGWALRPPREPDSGSSEATPEVPRAPRARPRLGSGAGRVGGGQSFTHGPSLPSAPRPGHPGCVRSVSRGHPVGLPRSRTRERSCWLWDCPAAAGAGDRAVWAAWGSGDLAPCRGPQAAKRSGCALWFQEPGATPQPSGPGCALGGVGPEGRGPRGEGASEGRGEAAPEGHGGP